MPDVSIVIPVAPYHIDLMQHAVWSARMQTVPVVVIPVIDRDERGAGWARNQGLAQVETEFVVFLDADDVLNRQFVARTMRSWQPGRYVYTDWDEDGRRVTAPACAWVNGTFHVITTLIPTAYLRQIGGFDEALDAAEDTDLFLNLMTHGYCGLHLKESLFSYGKAGRRSKQLVGTPKHAEVMAFFTNKYGGKPAMACCGENESFAETPAGERQQGDVIAQAIYAGNRQVRGRVTGRLYERTGNGKLLWIDPLDVEAMPAMFRIVDAQADVDAPDALDVFAQHFGSAGIETPPERLVTPDTSEPPLARKPNIGRLLDGYKRSGDGS